MIPAAPSKKEIDKKKSAFRFSPENQKRIEDILKKYPKNQQASAVLPLLDLAQRQESGWVSPAAIEEVARLLSMASIRVYEVASFYTMFNLKPMGKYHVQVCGTTPCWLRGAENIKQACEQRLGIKTGKGQITSDGFFSLSEVECLGACVNAPMVQINDEYYEDLTPESMVGLLDNLAKGLDCPAGSAQGRQGSAPLGKLINENIHQEVKKSPTRVKRKKAEDAKDTNLKQGGTTDA